MKFSESYLKRIIKEEVSKSFQILNEDEWQWDNDAWEWITGDPNINTTASRVGANLGQAANAPGEAVQAGAKKIDKYILDPLLDEWEGRHIPMPGWLYDALEASPELAKKLAVAAGEEIEDEWKGGHFPLPTWAYELGDWVADTPERAATTHDLKLVQAPPARSDFSGNLSGKKFVQSSDLETSSYYEAIHKFFDKQKRIELSNITMIKDPWQHKIHEDFAMFPGLMWGPEPSKAWGSYQPQVTWLANRLLKHGLSGEENIKYVLQAYKPPDEWELGDGEPPSAMPEFVSPYWYTERYAIDWAKKIHDEQTRIGTADSDNAMFGIYECRYKMAFPREQLDYIGTALGSVGDMLARDFLDPVQEDYQNCNVVGKTDDPRFVDSNSRMIFISY